MKRATDLAGALPAVALLAVVMATGCSDVSPPGTDQSDATTALTTTPSSAPPVNEESTSMHSEASHRATVVTNAGRIEAAVVDDALEMDVSTESGWESTVERDGNQARVVWTSGERSVVVDLGGTASGISQHVVSHG